MRRERNPELTLLAAEPDDFVGEHLDRFLHDSVGVVLDDLADRAVSTDVDCSCDVAYRERRPELVVAGQFERIAALIWR